MGRLARPPSALHGAASAFTVNNPAKPPLFRPRAVEAAAGSQFGEPLRTHWRGVAVFTALAFAAIVGLLIFLSQVEYAPIHRVPAYTDARAGLVRLRSPADGLVVTRLAVKEGAQVKRGALLAVLGSDRLRSDGSSQHAAQRQRLQEQQAALQREGQAARREAAAQQAMISERLAGLRSEIVSLQADLHAGEQLLNSLGAQSEQVASMASQGYVTRLQAAQKRDEATAQASRVAAARAALARARRDMALAQAERALVETRLAGLTESRRRASGELERQAELADSEAERVIRAPEDGTVSSALIAEGQSVMLGQALLTLTPLGQPLVLRLLVPARAAAAVRPALAIKYVLQAYPQEKFGAFDAVIESVSDAPTMPGDMAPAGTGATGEPVYVALARLTGSPRGPHAELLALKPGLLAQALVPLERRSALEWLFEPLLRGFNESAAP